MKHIPSVYVEDYREVRPKDLDPDFYSSDSYVDKLLQYLGERSSEDRDRPFFAYLAFAAPHWPLQAPDENVRKYKGMYDDGPAALRERRVKNLKRMGLLAEDAVAHEVVALGDNRLARDWASLSLEDQAYSSRTMEVYAGMVDRMDEQIGRVVSYLEATGELDNTLTIFMSDNGAEGIMLEAVPMMGDNMAAHLDKYYDNSIQNIGRKNSFVWYGPRWAQAGTAPSRLYKAFTSEGGIRVPLILRSGQSVVTGVRDLGKNSDGIVREFSTVMDIAPTILDLAGVKHPGAEYKNRKVQLMRGHSWVPYLTGATESIHTENHVVGWELFGRMGLRKGRWKATFIPEPFGPGVWQLYNLDQDPGETKDLRAAHPEKMAELLAAYRVYVEQVGVVEGQGEGGTFILDEDRST